MNNKDRIAAQELIIAKAQAEIKELESQQGKRWKPEIRGEFWYISESGNPHRVSMADPIYIENCYNNFNCYETGALATKADKMMKRNNAIIMACLIVDPDFVPDYLSGRKHYYFYYKDADRGIPPRWAMMWSYICNYGPCVSTEEKWEEAAVLLTEWGIT